MTRSNRSPRPGEAGFVLIGVVIFVLALTIIGMSLFSLSSYEARFLQRSIDGEQAFQSAAGGIERAKFVLATPPYHLENVVAQSPPIENIVAAVAIQDGQSTGAVDWDGTDVTIRVTAEVNGAQRTIEGLFTPSRALSYYSPLLTVSEGIEIVTVSTDPTYPDRNQRVWLDGPVWDSSPQDPEDWKPLLYPPPPDSIFKSPVVPLPAVAPFLTQHPGPIDLAALPLVSGTPTDPIYSLDAGAGGNVGYFRTPDESDPTFSLRLYPYGCQVRARGLAVWLMPRGIFVFEPVLIDGLGGQDCLVIIAGPNGIRFEGGLKATIPVILVSNGRVVLMHGENPHGSSSTVDLSIFARSAEFMGPADPALLPLHRNLHGPLNTFFLNGLAANGALPNVSLAGGRRLDLVPGTWHASDR